MSIWKPDSELQPLRCSLFRSGFDYVAWTCRSQSCSLHNENENENLEWVGTFCSCPLPCCLSIPVHCLAQHCCRCLAGTCWHDRGTCMFPSSSSLSGRKIYWELGLADAVHRPARSSSVSTRSNLQALRITKHDDDDNNDNIKYVHLCTTAVTHSFLFGF